MKQISTIKHFFSHYYLSEKAIFQRILTGSLWMICGSVVPKFLFLITFIFVARILGQDLYGKLSIIRSTINMFGVFASFGIGLTASRFIAQNRNIDARKVREIYKISTFFSFSLGLIIVIILLLIANYTSNVMLKSPDLVFSIKLGAVVLFFNTLNEAQNGALSGFEDFKSISINTFVSTFIQCGLIIIMGYWYGLNGVILSLGIGNLILWGMNLRSIRNRGIRNIKMRRISIDSWLLLWKFALPAAMSGILVLPVLWWSKSYLVRAVDFSNLAIYDVAEQWSALVMFVPAILGRIFLPILSNIYSTDSRIRYYKVVKLNLLLNVSVGVALSIFIMLFSNLILGYYGPGYSSNIPLFLMLISVVFSIAASVVGQIIASSGNMWVGFLLNFIWGVALVVFTVFFVGKLSLGAIGLSCALVVSYFVHLITSSIYVYIYLNRR